jgi:outer membrane protein OmpA-like peptidoglycan-associated protein
MRSNVLTILALLLAAPALLAQQLETGKVLDLTSRVIDLTVTVTDLNGAPVDIGGKVEDIQIRETDTEIRIDLAADVLFDFDKADILPKAADVLHKAAEVVRQHDKQVVRIEGHTDAKGGDAYNEKLSNRRADSVRRWLAEKEKLAGVHFETKGWGAQKPVAPNKKADGSDDPEGRQKNRRVEIVVHKG